MAKTFGLAAISVTVGFGLVSTIGGCSSASPTATELTASVESPIQGGAATTKYPFAVSITAQTPEGQAQCSGALIAPNLVLTARHCIDDVIENPNNANDHIIDCAVSKFGTQGAIGDFEISTCPNIRATSCRSSYSASKLFRTPGNTMCGNDMALILLTKNVPATEATPITPAVQYPIYDKRYTSAFAAVGYGITSPSANDTGTRRFREDIPIACIPGHTDALLNCDSIAPGQIPKTEFVGGDGPCGGDSGSSAYEEASFASGAPVSLGVLSRGGESDDGTTCKQSIYTRTDTMRDFIVAAVTEAAAKGGYAVPAWTTPVAPPPDAGAPVKDAGGSKPPTPVKGDGEACTTNEECTSKSCAAPNAESPFVCASDCSDTAPCADGFSCQGGLCFTTTDTATPAPAAAATTRASAGCSATARDPVQPIPWRALAFATCAFGLVIARRRGAHTAAGANDVA